tara:strand:+ start:311 stop:514 length:204 start_codon:yes stop_codon:yes gene_type:complete
MNILKLVGSVAGHITKATIKVGTSSTKSLVEGYASAFKDKEPEVLSPTNVETQSEKREKPVQMEMDL